MAALDLRKPQEQSCCAAASGRLGDTELRCGDEQIEGRREEARERPCSSVLDEVSDERRGADRESHREPEKTPKTTGGAGSGVACSESPPNAMPPTSA